MPGDARLFHAFAMGFTLSHLLLFGMGVGYGGRIHYPPWA